MLKPTTRLLACIALTACATQATAAAGTVYEIPRGTLKTVMAKLARDNGYKAPSFDGAIRCFDWTVPNAFRIQAPSFSMMFSELIRDYPVTARVRTDVLSIEVSGVAGAADNQPLIPSSTGECVARSAMQPPSQTYAYNASKAIDQRTAATQSAAQRKAPRQVAMYEGSGKVVGAPGTGDTKIISVTPPKTRWSTTWPVSQPLFLEACSFRERSAELAPECEASLENLSRSAAAQGADEVVVLGVADWLTRTNELAGPDVRAERAKNGAASIANLKLFKRVAAVESSTVSGGALYVAFAKDAPLEQLTDRTATRALQRGKAGFPSPLPVWTRGE